MSDQCPSLFSVLQAPIEKKESSVIDGLLLKIEALKIQSEKLSEAEFQQGLLRLAPLRLRSSGSLKKGQVKGWVSANDVLSEAISQDQHPRFEDVIKLNSLLTGQSQDFVIRTKEIYLGAWKAVSAQELPLYLDVFQRQILSENSQHSLVSAALAQYWLVSIHPFWDGNGRTSVLLADWVAGLGGYLPQSFHTQLDAIVGHFEGKLNPGTPGRAVIKILQNYQRSYSVVLNDVASSLGSVQIE